MNDPTEKADGQHLFLTVHGKSADTFIHLDQVADDLPRLTIPDSHDSLGHPP